MSDFRLSCYRLFQKHSLVKYRTFTAEKNYELRVLLVGHGTRMDMLLQEILINGQLLDTDLHVTVLTTNAVRSAKSILTKAPELQRYAAVASEEISLNSQTVTSAYAHINYQNIPKNQENLAKIFSKYESEGYNYIVISTGNDTKNQNYADIVSSVYKTPALIAYIQTKDPKTAILSEHGLTIFPFGFQKAAEQFRKLENIAYNLHYSYSKGMNDRASGEQIRAAFEEPYNYVSNIGVAMHIQEKMECCGIDMSDHAVAAEQFFRLMEDEPYVIERLAALEHRRWIMEKVMKGFKQAESLDMIYSGPGVTTHDGSNKWHVCLVPCDEVSKLNLEHWKYPDKDYKEELDSLDQISLKVHAKCGKIADNNREQIEEFLSVIHNSVERIFGEQEKILLEMHSMELAISQMWQNKRSAIAIYEHNFQCLLKATSSINSSAASYLKQSLLALKDALAPLKEYISFKDYKEQDRLLVKQIPFSLTHKKQPVLLKLLADKEADTLFSTCQLEPDHISIVATVINHNDYLNIKEKICNITRFLKQSYPYIAVRYHVILEKQMFEAHKEKLLAIAPEYIQLHNIEVMEYQNINAVLRKISENIQPDYVDVTGGEPLLMMSVGNLGVPIIVHKSGNMINIMNAPEINYPCPKKVITVKEVFDLSGSVLKEESDSSVLSDLSARYKKFFYISRNVSSWDAFCKYVSGIYKNENKIAIGLPCLNPNDKIVSKNFAVNSEVVPALMPIFNCLKEKEYISDFSISSKHTGQKTFLFKIPGDTAANQLVSKIHECIEHYTPTTSYKVHWNGKAPTILCSDLRIRKMKLPKEKKAEYKQILNELAASNLVIDYIVENSGQNDSAYSFEFASKDVLGVIQNSGKILELYVYYSALLEGKFDDVEMGWHFQHSVSENSADNELDIICTKGISSLFISAKNVAKKKLEDVTEKESQYLKYIIYEISLLARQFGLNAKPVLAMPEVGQFAIDEKTGSYEFSKEVKAAYNRGVYLLGKECFEGDKLAEILDRIVEGREDWCDFLKQK